MKAKPISRMHGKAVRHASRGRRDQRDLERPAMDSSSNSTKSVPDATSKIIPGAAFLRYYANHQLVAWQPQGVLDDRMLDEIAEWVVPTEKALQFNRFVDLSKLKEVEISTRHVFAYAQRRAKEFAAAKPVRSALFCEHWVGFWMACLYEELMKNTPIQARAFRELAKAARWLNVPVEILELRDKPMP